VSQAGDGWRPGRSALRLVVLLGLVSLFADVTYEGARSITGPFLGTLGASAAVVGIVSGLGELVGYGLRLGSGWLADRTRQYWAITIAGYAVNLVAVPLLALAGRWEIAAILIVTERLGKAIRTPARDVMLSHAAHELGAGRGFGLHEAMDQVGAVTGPLVVAGVLAASGRYTSGFAVLAAPAAIALLVLFAAWRAYPRPRDLEPAAPAIRPEGLGPVFWVYLAGVALLAAGFADFPLVAYHFGRTGAVPAAWIPTFYAVAMGVDALSALFFGRLYDRFGLRTLALAAALSALFAPLVFLGGFVLALLGMIVWGASMGAQESVMRAAVAGMAAAERRGTAYGIFNAGYGLAWFLGSVLLGILYDLSLPAVIAFSVVMQLLAVPVLLRAAGRAAS
jgi:MFS family permease